MVVNNSGHGQILPSKPRVLDDRCAARIQNLLNNIQLTQNVNSLGFVAYVVKQIFVSIGYSH